MLLFTVERRRQGLSQAALARKARIRAADICRLERGKAYPWPNWKRRIAAALSWPEDRADELFRDVTDDGNPPLDASRY